jgi:excisionase family DNA binding protein
MITVPEAAKRVGKNPETIRRWIRSGKLTSRKVGTQHLIDEEELDALFDNEQAPIPKSWGPTWTGEPLPNIVRIIREDRATH